MIISIDATGLGAAKTGTAVYLLEILRVWNSDKGIKHSFKILVSPKARKNFDELMLDNRFDYYVAPDNRHVRSLWQQMVLPLVLHKIGSDVHWGAGFVLPLLSRRPSVVTIYDVTFSLFPEVHERFKRWYFPWMIERAVKKAVRVISISETTKKDLVKLYPTIGEKIDVTLLAPRPLSVGLGGRAGDATEKYILTIGTVEPRKNLRRLISAWRAIPVTTRANARLLIAGAEGWMMRDLMEDAGGSEGVEFLGFMSDEELASLLKKASALAYPSLYEGFGLPVLEAMALGVPVLTSAIGATKEVAGDAAFLVDPYDESDIKRGLEALLLDGELRARLSEAGIKRAAEFSWQKTAAETMAVLEQAAGEGRAR